MTDISLQQALSYIYHMLNYFQKLHHGVSGRFALMSYHGRNYGAVLYMEEGCPYLVEVQRLQQPLPSSLYETILATESHVPVLCVHETFRLEDRLVFHACLNKDSLDPLTQEQQAYLLNGQHKKISPN